MNLSAVILTKNEEKNIKQCLNSVMFCDEIIIIDDYSTDKTIDITQKLKVKSQNSLPKAEPPLAEKIKIYKRELKEDFADQRNFGMSKAKGDWVLFIDADEVVTEELKKEIKSVVSCQLLDEKAFYIKRRDFWWGKELRYGEIKKLRNEGIIRLVRRNSGKWIGKVHEEFKVQSSNLKIKSLKNYINHYPHQTVKEFISEINFYSSVRALELYNSGKKTNIFEIIFFPLGKFLLNYFFYLGFLDGSAGFAYAFLMSFHSFLVKVKNFQY